MSDLISRSMYKSKLIKALDVLNKEYREALLNEDNDLILAIQNQQSAYMIALRLLDNEPTAYDIDKVVEELEADSSVKLYGSGNSDNYLIPIKRAIEIVKQGGVSDDVCEWKIDGVYLHSPHNRPFVTCISDDEDYRYNYCPVCGKKIKVVE